jgi:hypothetical protein
MSTSARKASLVLKALDQWVTGDKRRTKSARKGTGDCTGRNSGDPFVQLLAHKMRRKFPFTFKELDPFVALSAFRADRGGGFS